MANTPPIKIDLRRVRALMQAFAVGGKVDDLGIVDDRYSGIKWTVALDGATLHGFDSTYRKFLIQALESGLSEYDSVKYAYTMTLPIAGLY